MSHFSTNEDIELQIDDGSGTPHVDVNVDLNESTSSSFATANLQPMPTSGDAHFGMGLSAAMHMNSKLLVLESSIITADEAVRFEAQAKSMPHLKLAQVMLHRAIHVLDIKIRCDPTYDIPGLPIKERDQWQTRLTIVEVSRAIVKHFGNRPESLVGTINQKFELIPFHFSFANHEFENLTFAAYTEAASDYERSGAIINPDQHKGLIKILEKRYPPGSQILADYEVAKRSSPPYVTWEDSLIGFLTCVSTARIAFKAVRAYGNASTVWSSPASAVPPGLALMSGSPVTVSESTAVTTTPVAAPVPPAILVHRDQFTAIPQKAALATRELSFVPPVIQPRTCNSCGSPDHLMGGCPHLYNTDANNQHHVAWVDSTLGKAWAAVGYQEYQEFMVLPGYESRQRLFPVGTAPFALNNGKRARSEGYQNSAGAGRPLNQNQNQGQHSHLRKSGGGGRGRGNNTGGRGGYGNPSNSYNQGYINQGHYDSQGRPIPGYGEAQGNPRHTAPPGSATAQPLAQQNYGGEYLFNDFESRMSAISECMTNSITEPEFVHIPLTSQSNFLNVTVFVQGKEARSTTDRKQVAAAALLDTGSLAGDFVAMHVIDALNAHDLCYIASKVLTVCSGLDNACYANNTVIDLGIKFHAKDNVCRTIHLTVRVSPNSSIDLILGRNTLNKHNFLDLTPFAFGIPTEVSEDRKLKRRAEIDAFIEKDKLDRLDPTFVHKYTRRMLHGKLPVSSTALTVSLTPTYDEFMNHKSPQAIQRSRAYPVCTSQTRTGPGKLDVTVPMVTDHSMSCSTLCPCKNDNVVANIVVPELESSSRLGSVTTALATLTDETQRPGVDPIPTLSEFPSEANEHTLDTEVIWPSGVVLSVDEIDNERSDTFGPFILDEFPVDGSPKGGTENCLSELTFEGDESLQSDLKALCLKYSDLFRDTVADQPAEITPFRLDVDRKTWEVPANRGPLRPQSSKKEAEVKKALDKMLASGVIEKSDAQYYSHPVIVNKTPDSYRFCIDYRNLNDCIKAASWPLPNIKGLFERIGAYKPDVFGVMDLSAGYHQAPLYKPHRIFTAFLCFAGIYHFTRLPFGPKRAPSYFQEQMATTVLGGLIYCICEMYIDDCIVYAKGSAEFLVRLEQVFQRFRFRKCYLKASKCKFGLSRVEYVGRVVDKDGLSMSEEKIQSVLDFLLPSDVTLLRGLIGLVNYFRMFVPFHSDVMKPLQDMNDPKARKHSSIVWTPEGLHAFEKIKILISRCPLLHFLDDVNPIRLYTDASDYGIGAALFQIVPSESGNIWKPIAFISKSLTTSQLNWSTIQKEAYAIFYACKHLDPLIRDRKFTIHTDHMNITYLKQNPTSIVARWFMALQELDFSVHFIKGSENGIADALSRLCPNLVHLALPLPPSLIGEHAAASMSALVTSVPASDEENEAIQQCHNAVVGHGGVDRTMTRLFSLGFAWQYMRQHVRNFIQHCPCCQKMSAVKEPVKVKHFSTSSYSLFDCVNIDFVGPFPDKGYVLVIIDTFSRWTELFWCVDATARSACDGLLHHFGRFGSPNMIRSDRGAHFVNSLIREFLDLTGTPHNMTLAYSKQENAIVERINKEVNRHLRALTFENTSIERYRIYLPFVQRIINSNVNESTGYSPAAMLFGQRLDLNRGILSKHAQANSSTSASSASESITELIAIQNEVLTAAANKLINADAAHVSTTEEITVFPVNSYVLCKYNSLPPTRLHTRWQGPFKVVSFVDSEYVIQDLITKKDRHVHASTLKEFRFDPLKGEPAETAARDHMEYFVEKILEHAGNPKKPTSMSFLVKWLNWDETHNTWEPWKGLRLNDELHAYLRNNAMSQLVPKNVVTSDD